MSAVTKIADKAEQNEITVRKAAQVALEKAKGDTAQATKLLAGMVRKDSALRQALLEPLIEYACGNAVRALVHDGRSKVWNAPAVSPTMSQQDRVRLLSVGTLSMFQLPGGKRLGEAMRSDVVEAADFYGKQADDMAHKKRWLQLIGQSLPEGKRVSDVLSDQRLSELKDEASRA